METYRHEDEEGDWLSIAPRDRKPATALIKSSGGAEVTPAELPVITAKLYEACGQPSPVILERPSVSIPAGGEPLFCGDLSLRTYEGGVSMGLPGITAAAISPDALRRRAAFMAAYADALEAEPDPAEVDRIALVIHKASCACGSQCVRPPANDDRKAARAVLLDRRAS
jgi:hypothetical protein